MKLFDTLMTNNFMTDTCEVKELAEFLAKTPIFGGFTPNFFYSAAEHAVRISKILQKAGDNPEVQLYGLFYNADKLLNLSFYSCTSVRIDDASVQSWLMKSINLAPITGQHKASVTWANNRLRKTVARDILPEGATALFAHLPPSREPLLKPQPWQKAMENFILRYRELQTARGESNV